MTNPLGAVVQHIRVLYIRVRVHTVLRIQVTNDSVLKTASFTFLDSWNNSVFIWLYLTTLLECVLFIGPFSIICLQLLHHIGSCCKRSWSQGLVFRQLQIFWPYRRSWPSKSWLLLSRVNHGSILQGWWEGWTSSFDLTKTVVARKVCTY